jgi:hypothetical protein
MIKNHRTMTEETKNNILLTENTVLKNRMSFYAGSLEAVNYLLNKDEDVVGKNLEHIKYIVSTILDGLKKDL